MPHLYYQVDNSDVDRNAVYIHVYLNELIELLRQTCIQNVSINVVGY